MARLNLHDVFQPFVSYLSVTISTVHRSAPHSEWREVSLLLLMGNLKLFLKKVTRHSLSSQPSEI